MSDEPHRRRLRRVEHPGHVRYLTFSCYRRLPLLKNGAIKQVFLSRLARVCQEKNVQLLAWVVMPEHAHLLVLPQGEATLTPFIHAVKRPVAEQVLRRWRELNAPILRHTTHGDGHRFWQTGGGYDRNIFSTGELHEKIEYIDNNPIRRKIALAATDYAWSSARWYAGMPDAKLPCDPLPT